MNQIRKRLTYANVMSSIAVFLVLGGAAFAAVQLPKNSVGTKQLKKKAVTTAKIKDDAVTGAKAKEATFGQVPSAANADHAAAADKATTATKADSATTATKADSATTANSATSAGNATTAEGPVAFAHVSATGVLLGGRNISVAPSPTESYYCLSGIPFAPAGIQATADYWNGSPQFNTMVQAGLAASGGLGGTGCPAGTQAFVHGTRADNDTPSKAAFYVVVFR